MAIVQPVAQAAGRELPSKLQAAAPLSQGSRPGVQAGKQLWSHQQLPGAMVPLCQAAPKHAVSWVIQFSIFFSPKFRFLLILEHQGLCLCGGLLHRSGAQSHTLQPGASYKARSRAKPQAAALLLIRSRCSCKAHGACPATTAFPPARAVLLQHCEWVQHPSSCWSQQCLPVIYVALFLQPSASFCRDLGFGTGQLQCRNISC